MDNILHYLTWFLQNLRTIFSYNRKIMEKSKKKRLSQRIIIFLYCIYAIMSMLVKRRRGKLNGEESSINSRKKQEFIKRVR